MASFAYINTRRIAERIIEHQQKELAGSFRGNYRDDHYTQNSSFQINQESNPNTSKASSHRYNLHHMQMNVEELQKVIEQLVRSKQNVKTSNVTSWFPDSERNDEISTHVAGYYEPRDLDNFVISPSALGRDINTADLRRNMTIINQESSFPMMDRAETHLMGHRDVIGSESGFSNTGSSIVSGINSFSHANTSMLTLSNQYIDENRFNSSDHFQVDRSLMIGLNCASRISEIIPRHALGLNEGQSADLSVLGSGGNSECIRYEDLMRNFERLEELKQQRLLLRESGCIANNENNHRSPFTQFEMQQLRGSAGGCTREATLHKSSPSWQKMPETKLSETELERVRKRKMEIQRELKDLREMKCIRKLERVKERLLLSLKNEDEKLELMPGCDERIQEKQFDARDMSRGNNEAMQVNGWNLTSADARQEGLKEILRKEPSNYSQFYKEHKKKRCEGMNEIHEARMKSEPVKYSKESRYTRSLETSKRERDESSLDSNSKRFKKISEPRNVSNLQRICRNTDDESERKYEIKKKQYLNKRYAPKIKINLQINCDSTPDEGRKKYGCITIDNSRNRNLNTNMEPSKKQKDRKVAENIKVNGDVKPKDMVEKKEGVETQDSYRNTGITHDLKTQIQDAKFTDKSTPTKATASLCQSSIHPNQVHVSGFDGIMVAEDELKNFFSAFGNVNNINFPSHQRIAKYSCCIISYQTAWEAMELVNEWPNHLVLKERKIKLTSPHVKKNSIQLLPPGVDEWEEVLGELVTNSLIKEAYSSGF